jgi:hypothetical protein
MRKDKYSFKASADELSIKLVLEDNVDNKAVIKVVRRGTDRQVFLVRQDILEKFIGLKARLIAANNGVNWYLVSNPEAMDELEDYLAYEDSRHWFDVYTWK